MTNPGSARCEICGELMPKGEEMFSYHGYSGPCPKPPKEGFPIAGGGHGGGSFSGKTAMRDGADEIERLRRRVAELEAALKPFANAKMETTDGTSIADFSDYDNGEGCCVVVWDYTKDGYRGLTVGDFKRARAMLRAAAEEGRAS